MLKFAHFAFALSLLLFAHEATAGIAPHASFSRGFSSHASSSHIAAPHVPAAAPKPSFGAFGNRPSAPAPASDSALSRQLGRNASQAKALQTLDERNAARSAQNAAQSTPQPAPGHAQSAPVQQNAPAAPTTVIVHQDGGGLGHVLAGAMIANSMNAHARAGYYPTSGYNGPAGATQSGAMAQNGGVSFFRLFLTLCLLVAIAWGLWFAWKGVQRRRAALRDANKPNYSFERN